MDPRNNEENAQSKTCSEIKNRKLPLRFKVLTETINKTVVV